MQTSLSDLFLELNELSHIVCCHSSEKKSPHLPPKLYFFYDPQRHLNPFAIVKSMPAGSAFIFRHFGKAHIINMAKSLRKEAKKGSVLFIVGQDHNLAQTIEADGLHVPNWDRKLLSSKIKLPPHFLITASAHNQEELQSITDLYQTPAHIFVSPVFQTTSPSGVKRSIWELNELMGLIKSNPMIINALGGINRTNIRSLKALGFGGIGLGSLKDLSGQDINL